MACDHDREEEPLEVQRLRTGVYEKRYELALRSFGVDAIPLETLVLAYWSGRSPYLKFDLARNHGVVEAPGAEELRRVLNDSSQLAPKAIDDLSGSFLEEWNAAFLKVSGDAVISYTLKCDSDSGEFEEAVASGQRIDAALVFKVYTPPRRKVEDKPSEVVNWVERVFGDCDAIRIRVGIRVDHLAEDEGERLVAIDFGNSNTTMLAIDAGRFDGYYAEGDGVHSLELKTLVKFGSVQPQWTIEEDRALRGQGDLVLGAKRILADRSRSTYPLANERVIAASGGPAKVFLRQALTQLKSYRRDAFGQVVATYPTTYSASEIATLRRALAEAMLWNARPSEIPADHLVAMPEEQKSQEPLLKRVKQHIAATPWLDARMKKDPQYLRKVRSAVAEQIRERTPELVPHMLDEASASAFFFLSEDYLKQPGRTASFRYLYPDGVNLLLFDCGGGTTDIALVRIKAHREGDSKAFWRLKFTTLGRTGHRSFGGDDITAAVFKILKAELALRIKQTDPPADRLLCPDDETLAKYVVSTDVDSAVPTRWDSDRQVDERVLGEKQRVVDALWFVAEEAKLILLCGLDRPLSPIPQNGPIYRFLESNAPDAPGRAGARKAAAVAAAVNTVVAAIQADREGLRRRVDRLISADVDQCVRMARDLIRARLRPASTNELSFEDPVPPDAYIHAAYVLGKASSYRLIKERILSGLGVEERHLRFDRPEAKSAVARGAALAVRRRTQVDPVQLDWDRRLSERLPYSVYLDLSDKGRRRVWQEFSLYSSLTPYTFDNPASPVDDRPGQDAINDFHGEGPGDRRRLTLWRMWPGEDDADGDGSGERPMEAFLRFRFAAAPARVTVGYVAESAEFYAEDADTGERAVSQPVHEAYYVPHVRRGAL